MDRNQQVKRYSPGSTLGITACGMLAVTALAGIFGTAPKAPAAPPGKMAPGGGKTAAQVFKNIQVLKTLPANQLLPLMHKVSQSLGVGCDFCHVEGPNHTGFEKDTKPAKIVARRMIIMTQDLNKRYTVVANQVTCYTCHHGHAMPEGMPPMGTMGSGAGGGR